MVDFYTDDGSKVGDERYSYKKHYEVIQINDSRKYFGSLKLFDNSKAPGINNVCSRYGNHLKNGFINSDIPLNLQDKPVSVDSICVNGIYTVNHNILIDESSRWTLFNSNIKKVLASEENENYETTYSTSENNFMAFGGVIEEYSDKGKELNTTMHYAGGLYFSDAFRRGGDIVFSGSQTGPNLPEGYPYYGTIQIINRRHIKARHGEISDIKRKNIFTFTEYDPGFPVFGDKLIYQPFSEGIIVLDYSLHIKHLFKLDEKPFLCSMNNSNTLLFTITSIEKKYSLFICTSDGLLVGKFRLPPEFGEPVAPPVISNNNSAIIVTNGAIIAVSPDGKIIWNHKYPEMNDFIKTYALLYNNSLAVSRGRTLTIFNISDGKILFSKNDFDHLITTPLIYNGKKVLIGTEKILYEFRLTRE